VAISFKSFIEPKSTHKALVEAPFCVRRLREHLGAEPTSLPIVSEAFAQHEHPNIRVALEDYLARNGRSAEILGVIGQLRFMGQSLSELVERGIHPRACAQGRADHGAEIVVTGRHLDEAPHELVGQGSELTKSLLGNHSKVGFRTSVTRPH
jgi:hypothetical protein